MRYRPMFGNARKDVLAGMLLGIFFTTVMKSRVDPVAGAMLNLCAGLFFFVVGVRNRNHNQAAEVAFVGMGSGFFFSGFAKILTGCFRLSETCQNSILSSIKMSEEPRRQRWMEQNIILLISATFSFVGYRNRERLDGTAALFIGLGLILASNIQDVIVGYHSLLKRG